MNRLKTNRWDFGYTLETMNREARKSNALVFRFEDAGKASPFRILVSTMLSARTKDETTIQIVKELFRTVGSPRDVLRLNEKQIEKILYGIGFYRLKAKYLKQMAEKLINEFNGKVPDTIDALLSLPGVGRKTANIVLARAFGKNTIGVDVHVHRIANRLGLVKTKRPEDTEQKLVKIVQQRFKRNFNRTFVAYGQTICIPRKPKCDECKIRKICKYGQTMINQYH